MCFKKSLEFFLLESVLISSALKKNIINLVTKTLGTIFCTIMLTAYTIKSFWLFFASFFHHETKDIKCTDILMAWVSHAPRITRASLPGNSSRDWQQKPRCRSSDQYAISESVRQGILEVGQNNNNIYKSIKNISMRISKSFRNVTYYVLYALTFYLFVFLKEKLSSINRKY